VEADLKPYDYMALVPIIAGAGGVVTDWAGRQLTWQPDPSAASDPKALADGWPGEVVAAGDAVLHAKALQLLDWRT